MQSVRRITTSLIALAATGAIAACHTRTEEPAAGTANTTTVERVTTPEPTPAPTVTSAVIQSQPGPKGMVATLNKVQVTGDVLTVQLTMTGKDMVNSVPVEEINLIDNATSQRIGVLKDDTGKWMASPMSGERLLSMNLYDSPAVVWMKFPAPPATSKTVSLNIPTIAPFDGVPVTR